MNTLFKTVTRTSETHKPEKEESCSKIIIRDIAVEMLVGIHNHEKQKKQRVIINLEAGVQNNPDWKKDSIDSVVNYSAIVSAIQGIAEEGHINLLETFAEKIALFCLQDNRILNVRVHIEKPDCYAFAKAGIEVFRVRG